MQKFIVKITSENISLIDDSRVECFLLDSAADTAFNRRFAEAARKAGKLLLSCGDKAPELCRELGLDGVVVDLSKNEKPKAEFQFLRNFLGKDAVIGAVTRNRRPEANRRFPGAFPPTRRHEAMVISEFEPDFLVFQAWNDGIEQVRELVSWYNGLFLIQSAILCRDENLDYAGFDCDIVILSDREYTIFVAKKQSLD